MAISMSGSPTRRFARYCEDSPLPGIAAKFLKTDKVNLLYDQLFVKEPGNRRADPLAQRPAVLAGRRLARDVVLAGA